MQDDSVHQGTESCPWSRERAPGKMMDNAQVRKWAQTMLEGRWLKAAAIALLVALCLDALEALLSYVALHGLRMSTYSYDSGVTLSTGGDLLVSLLLLPARALTAIGLTKYYFMTAKGQSPTLGTCFHYFKHNSLRAMGLILKIGLMTFVWFLPGFGVMLLAIPLRASFLVWIGAILMAVLGGVAILRYSLIPFYMVEHPDCTITEAFEQGKEAVANHKWVLFCLWFSTIGWASAVAVLLGLIFNGLDAFPFAQIFTVLSSPLTVLWGVASAIFYLERKWVLNTQEDAYAFGWQNGAAADRAGTRIEVLENRVADLEQQLAEAKKNPAPDEPSAPAESIAHEDGGIPHGGSEELSD